MMGAVRNVTPAQVKEMIRDRGELAFIDVREPLSYGGGHPLFAVNIPLSQLEFRFARAVPRKGTRIVLLDDGGGFADTAAGRLERFGYTDIAVMSGKGVSAWAAAGYELFNDIRVLVKAFSAFIEKHAQPEFIEPEELKAKIGRGEDLIVLDSRPAPEYRAGNIPGSIDAPGPDLLRRYGDLVPSPETLVVVNCMSRTRGILGSLSLVQGGVPNRVVALRNGTSGWRLAGFDLERNANRFGPPLSESARQNAQARTARLGSAAGIVFIDGATLARWGQDEKRTTYLVDVRDREAFLAGHLSDSISVPGGGIIMHPDEVAATINARLVLVDDDGVRATVTAFWLKQMGLFEVAVLRSGLEAQDLESGDSHNPILGLDTAVGVRIGTDALGELLAQNAATVIDLGPSATYKAGHIPGAYFVIRAYLADALASLPSMPSQLVLTSPDGRLAHFAEKEAAQMVDCPVTALEGGTAAWKAEGKSMETGSNRMLSPEHDRWLRAHERPGDLYANMRAYLDWETNLLTQIDQDGDAPYVALKGERLEEKG